jgi:hypothetical protein
MSISLRANTNPWRCKSFSILLWLHDLVALEQVLLGRRYLFAGKHPSELGAAVATEANDDGEASMLAVGRDEGREDTLQDRDVAVWEHAHNDELREETQGKSERGNILRG